MITPQLVTLLGSLLAVMTVGAGGMLLVSVRRDRSFRRRALQALGETSGSGQQLRRTSTPWLIGIVAAIGRGITGSGLLPASTLAELEDSLRLAGLGGSQGLGLFIGAKLLLLINLPVAAILITREMSLTSAFMRAAPFIAGVVGLLLPDKILSVRSGKRRANLERGVPDALDMMVICTQAGLGLASTMERVSIEIAHAHPAIARELAQTVSELQIAVSGSAALTALGTRTGLSSLKRVATTLVQTIQYGTPLSEALRGLAAEMRHEALTRYEEKAARLPVMLTIPMIILVLPCVFIVVGGPAVLQISKALGH